MYCLSHASLRQTQNWQCLLYWITGLLFVTHRQTNCTMLRKKNDGQRYIDIYWYILIFWLATEKTYIKLVIQSVCGHMTITSEKNSAAILEEWRPSWNKTRCLRFLSFLVVLTIKRDAQALVFAECLKTKSRLIEPEFFSTNRGTKWLSAIGKGPLFNQLWRAFKCWANNVRICCVDMLRSLGRGFTFWKVLDSKCSLLFHSRFKRPRRNRIACQQLNV